MLSSQAKHGLEAKITKNPGIYCDYSDISLATLATLPPFLRFDKIELICSWGNSEDGKAWDTQSMDAKCQFFEDQLRLIDPENLNDAILLFDGDVNENNSSRFYDYSKLLSYLRDQLAPICKWRGYGVKICLYSERSLGKYVISSVLQIPQIGCSSKASIRIRGGVQTELPVKEISNWLLRKRGNQLERSLSIYSTRAIACVLLEL